jgi:hypothetical protein
VERVSVKVVGKQVGFDRYLKDLANDFDLDARVERDVYRHGYQIAFYTRDVGFQRRVARKFIPEEDERAFDGDPRVLADQIANELIPQLC